MAGGTVAKFVTTITILLLLTVVLVSNILIFTNDVSITTTAQLNSDSLTFLDKISYIMNNGTDSFYSFKSLYNDSIKVNDNFKEIDDGIANIRSLKEADYDISDYTNVDGYIADKTNDIFTKTITYPDGSTGKT